MFHLNFQQTNTYNISSFKVGDFVEVATFTTRLVDSEKNDSRPTLDNTGIIGTTMICWGWEIRREFASQPTDVLNVIRHRSVTCNRIISMSTGSRFRVLNHDQIDRNAKSMHLLLL